MPCATQASKYFMFHSWVCALIVLATLSLLAHAQENGSSLQTMTRVTQLENGYRFEEIPAQYDTERYEIVTQGISKEFVIEPATYETVTETVIVQPAMTVPEIISAEYEWAAGEISGFSVEYRIELAEFETVQDAIIPEAPTELMAIPPIYNPDGTIAVSSRVVERLIPNIWHPQFRRIVKTPAKAVKVYAPYEIKDGKTRIDVIPARVVEKDMPAITKQVTRRILKTPAHTTDRIIPSGTKTIATVRVEVKPARFILRDANKKVVHEFASREEFEDFQLRSLANSPEE